MNAEDIRSGFISRADRVLLLVEEKRAGLAAPGAEQWQVLSLIRFHLLRAFNELVVFKQDHILFPAILEDNGRGDGFVARLNTANLDVQRDYDAFVQNWMLKNPLSISERYRVEATKMMEEIERMVRLDKEAVIGLLDRKPVAD